MRVNFMYMWMKIILLWVLWINMINENDYLKSKFSTFLFVNICDKCYTGDKYKWLSIGLCMLDPMENQFCCHRNLYMDSFWCRNSHKTLTMKTTDLKYITLKKNEIKILFTETRFRISLKIFLQVKIISWSTA